MAKNVLFFDLKFLAVAISLLLACNPPKPSHTAIEKENPLELARAYLAYYIANDLKNCYDLISTKSKKEATYLEFTDAFDESNNKGFKILKVDSIIVQTGDAKYPDLLKVRVYELGLIKKDTCKGVSYITMEKDNDSWKVVWTKATLLSAYKKYYSRDYVTATKFCQDVINIDPFNGYAFELLGWIKLAKANDRNYYSQKQELDRDALSNFRQAISLEQGSAPHYKGLAEYYESNNESDSAILYNKLGLYKCFSRNDSVLFLTKIGYNYYKKDENNFAEKYIDDALNIDPKYFYALYFGGCIYNKKKDFLNACRYFEKIVLDDAIPKNMNGRYYFDYAIALKNVGNEQKAEEYFNKALELAASSIDK